MKNISVRTVENILREKRTRKMMKMSIQNDAMTTTRSFGSTVLWILKLIGLWVALSVSASVAFGVLNFFLAVISERFGGIFMDTYLIFYGGIFVYLVYFTASLWGFGGVLISFWFRSRIRRGAASAIYGFFVVSYFFFVTITNSWGEAPIEMEAAPIVVAVCAILTFALSMSPSLSKSFKF